MHNIPDGAFRGNTKSLKQVTLIYNKYGLLIPTFLQLHLYDLHLHTSVIMMASLGKDRDDGLSQVSKLGRAEVPVSFVYDTVKAMSFTEVLPNA